MLTWEQLAELFAQMELELIASLKRNLTRHKDWETREGFEWPAWQALKLRAIGRYKQENRQIVREYMDVIGPETDELLRAQFAEGQDETAADYPDQAGHTPVSDGVFFGVNERRMNALLTDTQQLEEKASSAALRMMDDVYRQTLHRAEIAMAAGAVTLPKAIDKAVEDFLRAGINCIEYKNGRRVNIADYAEMALRTAATRAKLQGDAAMRARLGMDTVRVSQYGMCSETCLPWQGRVYIDDVFGAWDGERAGDRGKSINGNWYPLLSVAVENGLFHPNCRHTLTTWYEGTSTPPKLMDPAQIRKNSALEQQQRALERAVRQARRLETGSTDTESIRKYSLQRRDAQKKLKAFVDEHSDVLRRAPWKEKVYEGQESQFQQMQAAGFGNKDSQMAGVDLEMLHSAFPASSAEDREVKDRFIQDISVMPAQHRMIVEDVVQKVVLTYDKSSGFDPKSKALRVNRSFIEGDMVHECGHILAEHLKIYDSNKFYEVLSNGLENVDWNDIIPIDDTFQIPIVRLKCEKFISEYQGRMYPGEDGIFDEDGNLDLRTLKEYFSEGYRAYFFENDVLKQKDPLLFKYIEEWIENGTI